MGIFASPFRYSPTYDVGLNTGTPEVGATLRRPKNKKTPEPEKVPSRVPNEGGSNGETSGAQSGSTSNGLTASVGLGAGIAAQGSSARSMMAQRDAEPSNAASLSQSQFQTLIHPNPISAPANPTKTTVAPAASSPGFWSQIGHDISNVAHNPIVHDVMSFGDPFKSRDTGIAGALSGSSTAAPVIEPSNVYSPSRNFPEVSSGSPKVIQGSVEGANSVGSGARNAIGRSPVYEANNIGSSLGKQFMGSNGSAVDTSTPWYDSIPNDLSSISEDIFAGL